MPLSRFSDKLNGGIKFVPIIITGLPEFEARFWIMRDEKYISWSRVVLFSKTSLNSFSTPLINLFLHSEVEQGSKMMKWVELGRRVRLRAWQGSCTPCQSGTVCVNLMSSCLGNVQTVLLFRNFYANEFWSVRLFTKKFDSLTMLNTWILNSLLDYFLLALSRALSKF